MVARLIINADDFGLTPGINRAIAELHKAGVLSSATLMATGPSFDKAVILAKGMPTLGVGCHLVFTDGIPVSHPESIPTLLGADGKTFRPSVLDFAQAVLRGTVRAADVARETQAQIQKLQRAGIDVTHVDTHKHTHLLPAIAETVLHIAERCGVAAIRNPFEPKWSRTASRAAVPRSRRLQFSLASRFEAAFNKLARSYGAEITTAGTLAVGATGRLDASLISGLLRGRAERCRDDEVLELCCHPGYCDLALSLAATRLQRSREVEVRALAATIPDILEEPKGFQLIHYGRLGIAGHQRAAGHFVPHTGYEKVL